ncbi:MAG: MAPEG family protein [Gammaproteobacteria bacterium]|nr:MAPEG family protein [Gammaproteobacteria bacterium]
MTILFPMLAMVGLTVAVALRMYLHRVAFMKANRIHPQKVDSRTKSAEHLTDTRASDNFMNLFEMPVLFYLACITIYVTNSSSLLLVALAWAYVIFRIAHSLIHCSYNKVMHRFTAFILSAIVLLFIWLIVAAQLIFGTQLS